MKSLLDRLTRTLVRRGFREGLLKGNTAWLAAGAAAWLVRYLMKKREPEVIVERLAPGERIVVENLGPQHGRAARKARRASLNGRLEGRPGERDATSRERAPAAPE